MTDTTVALRTGDLLDLLAAGATPDEAARMLGVTDTVVRAHVDGLLSHERLKTVRALVYEHEAGLRADQPAPGGVLDLDPVTEAAWAGLRLDVPDQFLVPEIATTAGLDPAEVGTALEQLTAHHATTWQGLIRLGYRHGVLSGLEGTAPSGVWVGRGGVGNWWELRPIRLWVLELTASGWGTERCARRMGISQSAVCSHIRACAQKAGVDSRAALIQEALRARVLAPPEPRPVLGLSDQTAAVWQGIVLDVPAADLASAISRQTDLPVHEVAAELKRLRNTHKSDCRLVVEGWAAGVLDDQATVSAPADRRPRPANAYRGTRHGTLAAPAALKLTRRERDLLNLVVVQGHTVEQAGVSMGIGTYGASRYLRTCLLAAETDSVRVLAHKACRAAVLSPEKPPTPRVVSDDVLAVWRALALDTPDVRLVRDIATVTGLSPHRVEECLTKLRSTGLTDGQLVLEGWARHILDGQTSLAPPRPPVRATAPVPRRASRPARRPGDPLGLVPEGLNPDHAPEHLVGCAALEGGQVAGDTFDFIRVTPARCRELLQNTVMDWWGPVLGLPAAGIAVLVTEIGAGAPEVRGPGVRRWAHGGAVRLPEYGGRPTADGAYWAVPAGRPPWAPALIASLFGPHTGRPS
ncbi:LuxR C-terminal-related transcriptional regulator [Streptomyces sp. NPDC001933]|uniref:LuxR C-terminal-related transcriptional regulator n=1 Tax=Streptomyces sp. NPDC001933 TaxID=3364626 RepID=UPI00367B267C